MDTGIEQLLHIMQTLRDPENGCPWDLQQDFASIAPYTIEEAFEVADAIQRNNLADLRDELGDLLFQVVFHAQMAEEQQVFDFSSVVQSICSKMKRRHPHVFGSSDEKQAAADSASVRKNWESIKQAERVGQGASSVLDGIPRGMAELQRALKLQKRAASVGFDWNSAAPVIAKLHEETAELEQAISNMQEDAIRDELGDLLFTMVNLARKLHIDAGQALREANAKFESRFRVVEQISGGPGNMSTMGIEELEQLWQTAKAAKESLVPGGQTGG